MTNPIGSLSLALALLVGMQNTSQATDAQRPNIVVILCDDLGYADVGFSGSKDIPTPSLDALAKSGTIFSSAYVCHPFCGPSRAGLLSGRYPHVFGSQFNLPEMGSHEGFGIPVGEILIGDVLQDAGYFTGLIGKWHLGEAAEFHPNHRGFDDFFGFLGGGHSYFPEQFTPEYERQVKAGNKDIWRYLTPLEHNGQEVQEAEYVTDALSREGVRFVKEAAQRDQPFFLLLAYNAPHTPLEAKEEDLQQVAGVSNEKRRTFAAMVYAVDRGVQTVVDALKATGEYENTLIVFLSDNGGRTDEGANNYPLRGAKGDTYEGGFRVPMFFHWPNVVPADQRYDFPVTALDFFPTFAGLAGATVPADKQLAGKNIWEDFLAERNPREGELIFALRHRIPNHDIGARCDQWKIHRSGKTPWQLYNVESDISEQHDLSAQFPEQLQAMVAQTKQWSESHTKPRWYDSEQAAKEWKEQGMPNFDQAFQLISLPSTALSARSPSAEGAKALGENKEEFVARWKNVWENKGWKWNRSKVEANFLATDTNRDGFASPEEIKIWLAETAKGADN